MTCIVVQPFVKLVSLSALSSSSSLLLSSSTTKAQQQLIRRNLYLLSVSTTTTTTTASHSTTATTSTRKASASTKNDKVTTITGGDGDDGTSSSSSSNSSRIQNDVGVVNSTMTTSTTIAFFGSLCLLTFGLGIWQCQRFFEKKELEKQRTDELFHMEPITLMGSATNNGTSSTIPTNNNNNNNNNASSTSSNNNSALLFRRMVVRGSYDHSHEVLVGPRGPPPGIFENKPGQTAQGMASSPQGYYVLTPLYIDEKSITTATGTTGTAATGTGTATTNQKDCILVNRGWIPRNLVMNDSMNRRNRNPTILRLEQQQQWDRPEGIVEITVVPSKIEEPKFLVAEHNFKVRPPILYWFDLPSMLACAGMPFVENTINDSTGSNNNNNNKNKIGTISMVVMNNNNNNSNKTDEAELQTLFPVPIFVTQVQQQLQSQEENVSSSTTASTWPVCPNADKVGEFKVPSMVHAGYAMTWFGLSAAGIYMTRMIVTKGR